MERPRRGSQIELEIDNLAFGGQGVSRLDGFVVFVAGAVPGDRVRAVVTKVKRRYAEARLESILRPSADRIDAGCRHYGSCGGCRWQSLAYPTQLKYKERQVRESLERLGGLTDFEVRPVIGMEDPWRYRNKVEFSIGPGPEGPLVGFHPPGRWDQVLPMTECHLVSQAAEAVRTRVEQWIRKSGRPGWDPRSQTGYFRHLTVREGRRTNELLVSLATAPGELPLGLPEALLPEFPQLVGILHARNEGQAEVANALPYRTLHGRSFLYEELGGLRFKVSIDAFFQTNTEMAEKLYARAGEEAGLTGDEAVWDLYSGIGSIALYLARRARAVLGIEVVAPAVADARDNARLNGIDNVTFLEGNARVVLKEVLEGRASLPPGLEKPDVVVLDPPRGGLAKKVIMRAAAARPARIVYVSCNPATMADNLKDFAEHGYRLVRVTPVDMFPHTPHIEAVGLLEATD